MKKYSAIFFDLDHTLWDFEQNSKAVLSSLFSSYDLQKKGISGLSFFFETFTRINTHLWDLHDKNLIGQDTIRNQRFHKVFFESGLDDYELSLKFSKEYLSELPKGQELLPNAKEILDYLYPKYPMLIITNGFDEMQELKMRSSGISQYFKSVVTSQRAGDKKPSKRIFDFTLQESGYNSDSVIMIGDNLQTDIVGAKQAGLDTVYLNPLNNPHNELTTHEIRNLGELKNIL